METFIFGVAVALFVSVVAGIGVAYFMGVARGPRDPTSEDD